MPYGVLLPIQYLRLTSEAREAGKSSPGMERRSIISLSIKAPDVAELPIAGTRVYRLSNTKCMLKRLR
ncbi:hypothetical protein P3T76_007071 [Phytophthora citrophthora]|uniref:Uncharacterized protein n=1 Tax=Phytophthora citrophthora TaxID=4793 RepID=A0AAD9GML5_9STRA|nr:hypothetical protein P3T76_007071 [Phytophthora citrophthora]